MENQPPFGPAETVGGGRMGVLGVLGYPFSGPLSGESRPFLVFIFV